MNMTGGVEVAAASPSNLLNPTPLPEASYPAHLPIINPSLIPFQQRSRMSAVFFGEIINVHPRLLQEDGQPCRLLWSWRSDMCVVAAKRHHLVLSKSPRPFRNFQHCTMQYQDTRKIARPPYSMYQGSSPATRYERRPRESACMIISTYTSGVSNVT